jgi:hypothetical protein
VLLANGLFEKENCRIESTQQGNKNKNIYIMCGKIRGIKIKTRILTQDPTHYTVCAEKQEQE